MTEQPMKLPKAVEDAAVKVGYIFGNDDPHGSKPSEKPPSKKPNEGKTK